MPDYREFAKKIKEKYPDYKDVDDMTLSKKMIEKYPEYKNQVTFDVVESEQQPAAVQPPAKKKVWFLVLLGRVLYLLWHRPSKRNNSLRLHLQ